MDNVPKGDCRWIEVGWNTSQFNKYFTKKYNVGSDERYFLGSDVQYPVKLCEIYNDLSFLPEKIKMKNLQN